MKSFLNFFGYFLVLTVAASGGLFETSGRPSASTVIYPFGLESARFPDNWSEVLNGVEAKASFIATWQKQEFGNGTWFFARIHCEASAARVGQSTTGGGDGMSANVTLSRQNVFLSHFHPLSGEPNLTGQQLKLSLKFAVKGKLRAASGVPPQTFGPSAAQYGFVSSSPLFPLQLQRVLPDPETHVAYNFDSAYDDEQWTPPAIVSVGPTGFFVLNYGVVESAGANNQPGQTSSVASATGDAFISGFRVSDLTDNVIWEYTRNADGSPGDRFALALYDPNAAGGTGMAGVLAPGNPPPSIRIHRAASGNPEVDYEGVLQQTDDLAGPWQDAEPQPAPPFEVVDGTERRFFRARIP